MYTRSYNIRSQKPAEPPEEQKPEPIDLPDGYSGTLMLREQEPETEEVPIEIPDRPPIRRHKPVKFSFTRVPKDMQGTERKEKNAPDVRMRSDNDAFVKAETAVASNDNCAYEAPEIGLTAECAEKKHRKPELDRMLLGALMLMLISEGTDDVLMLILGYLFL